MGAGVTFHPLAWLAWWGGAAVAVLMTRNPLYVGLALLAALWVRVAVAPRRSGHDPWRWIVSWGWLLVLGGALLNGLTIHYGETVIARLPPSWPLVGGNITLEAVAFGFLTSLNLLALLLLFAAFGAGADYAALLRFVPGFLWRAGLVTSVALTFVPQTARTFREVHEAQTIRGHRFRSWRDMLPLFVPVLVTGLERSVQLAEAMESRGFGSTPPDRRVAPRLALLVGTMVLLLGLGLRQLWAHPWLGGGCVLGGAGLLLWGLRRMGSRVHRTRYRLYPWRRRDLALVGAGGLMGIGVLAARVWAPHLLLYYPYPRLSLPTFAPWVGLLFGLVATPALLVELANVQVGSGKPLPPPDGGADHTSQGARAWRRS